MNSFTVFVVPGHLSRLYHLVSSAPVPPHANAASTRSCPCPSMETRRCFYRLCSLRSLMTYQLSFYRYPWHPYPGFRLCLTTQPPAPMLSQLAWSLRLTHLTSRSPICWSEVRSIAWHPSVVEAATSRVRVPAHSRGHGESIPTEDRTPLWCTSSRAEMRAGTRSTIKLDTLFLQDI